MANLFINACVRKEFSRTLIIAKKIMEDMKLDYTEIDLHKKHLKPLNIKRLNKREKLLKEKKLSNKMFEHAKQFAEAENIIIAAPYWDLAFPSLLKIYLENICVSNITFMYNEKGPVGLCKAKKLIYITTAGGNIFTDFGYTYVKSLANSLFGIKNTICYKAENLDVENITIDNVLQKANVIKVD